MDSNSEGGSPPPLQEKSTNALPTEQVQIHQTENELESFWQQGMRSRKSKLVFEASSKTGLGIPEVKNWISKKKKRVQRAMDKENGVPPKEREKTALRKKRGYDLFMSERLKQEDLQSLGMENNSEKLRLAQRAWRELPDDEKEMWNKRAEEVPKPIEGPNQMDKKIAKLEAKCEDLWAMNAYVTLLIPDGKGSFRIHGPPETKSFWTANDDAPVLQAYADELRSSLTSGGPKNADRLRKEIQNLFNVLYQKATGKRKHCSYKEIDAGQITALGMPEGIELKRPGEYNMPERQAILQKAADIRFEVRDLEINNAQLPVGGRMEELNQPHTNEVSIEATTEDGSMDERLEGHAVSAGDSVINDVVIVHELEIQVPAMEEAGSVIDMEGIESAIAGPFHSDDEVTDLTSCSPEESMRRAEKIAREWEDKSSQKKRTSRLKRNTQRKNYMSTIVGRRVKQLWKLQDKRKPARWFEGTVVQSSDGTYNINFDGEENLHPLTAAKTKQLLKKKTLCFI